MKTSAISALFVVTLTSVVQSAVPTNFPQLMLTAVNAERARLNPSALCLNAKLQKAAQLHSTNQATNNSMSHTGSGGSTMQSRVNAQQFNWNLIAENVAAGQVDVAAVMASWMNSPGHKKNILGSYKFFGTGYAYNGQATYKHYWTQDFAAGSGETCEQISTPTPAPTTKAPTLAPVAKTPTVTPTTMTPTTSSPGTKAPTPAPVAQVATVAPTTKPPTVVQTSAPTTVSTTIQQRMLAALNAERAKVGMAPLCTNAKLQKAWRSGWSAWTPKNGTF